ncbi:MAG: AI-2E family transporter [Clostridia bacterium]|nr:AI-2E family transporter [Clostridia bacterium]
MKYKPDQRTKDFLIGAGLTGGALILLIYVLNNISVVADGVKYVVSGLSSVILGLVFAYFLNIPCKWIETRILVRMLPKASLVAKRTISIVVTLVLTFAIIAGVISIVLPRLISTLGLLLGNLDSYRASVISWVERLADSTNQTMESSLINTLTDSVEDFISKSMANLSSLLPAALSSAADMVSTIFNVVFGLVISIYILASREKLCAQVKKLATATLPKGAMERATEVVHVLDDTFQSYLSGQIIDAVLVGVECYVLSLVFNLPYAPLLGVVIGLTNVIPILGPYIGGIPCGFIVLVAGSPLKLIIFAVMVLVIQQIDGNIVSPRIIGDRTGVPGLWVIVGVMVGSYFFGILGVLLAIPVISVMLNLIREFTSKKLAAKGEPLETTAYYKYPVQQQIKETKARKRGSHRSREDAEE